MKYAFIKAAVLGFSFVVASFANATVVTFDDIANGAVANGYNGLNWDNVYTLNAVNYNPQNSGYFNGLVSGESVAYNAWGDVGLVSGGTFDFNGAFLTAAWNNGLNITVTGFLAGLELYSQTVVVDTTSPTWFNFNFTGIDSLSFNSFGGVDAGLGGGGNHFAMDNFTFNEASVPESSSIFLLGLGLLGLFGARKLRK